MSEIVDLYKEMKEQSQRESRKRRDQAEDDFEFASVKAKANGFALLCHSDTHYSLRKDGWIIDVFPGNQRLRKAKGNAPYLYLDDVDDDCEWTLGDVVQAAITQN